MRTTATTGLLVLLWTALAAGCAAAPESAPPLAAVVTEIPLRADASTIPPVGERCRYDIRWGFLPVGSLEYRVGSVDSADGPLLELVGITESSGVAGLFLGVSGTMRSLVEQGTLLPRVSLWTTLEKEDPQIRSVDFRQEQQQALSVKYTRSWMVQRVVRGPRIHDSLSSIYLTRVLSTPEQGEVRMLLVEGENLHLMTVRSAGFEVLDWNGEQVPCEKLSLRTDRIDDQGLLLDEEPWNSLYLWVAKRPGRPILRMSGKTRFARVVLKLEERRVERAVAEPTGASGLDG